MSAPLLSVRGLTVEFPTKARTLTALDQHSPSTSHLAKCWAWLGESGGGQDAITGSAIIGLIEPPAVSPRARSC